MSAPSNLEKTLWAAKHASYQLASLSHKERQHALKTLAAYIAKNQGAWLKANQRDLQANQGRINSSLYERLKLDVYKIRSLIDGTRDIARLNDPLGKVSLKTELDHRLRLERVSVPLGVLAIIFESRPDVLPQIVALALKSGNALVLKGGSEALHSNRAFMKIIQKLNQHCRFLPRTWCVLIESREAALKILQYPKYIDLVIPRGSNQLVQKVMSSTKIPVLGHADGICHVYVHSSASQAVAVKLILDAKTQYPAACNSAETALIDAKIAKAFLNAFVPAAERAKIRLYACVQTRKLHPELEPARFESWSTEYGDKSMNLKIVTGPNAAIEHINRFGSHHTDAILAKNAKAIGEFFEKVDSATVLSNASTRFADGYRFGLGAEVGISTSKIHARGPVGIEGLTIYKYRVRGNGQTVNEYLGPQAKRFTHRMIKQ